MEMRNRSQDTETMSLSASPLSVRWWRRKPVILLIIWLFATIINLDKAYHIDDSAHLEIAQWIFQEPLRPMSGQINWHENAEPIHLLNQPHLYFYLLAVWGRWFGFGEIQMHILQSLFTLACIILTCRIAEVVIPSRALLLTALLTLSPGFVVGQNLMVDIPVLSLWLAFFYTMINPKSHSDRSRFVLAGLIAGLACLIKYSSLPLIAVMAAFLIVRKKVNLLWTVAIPLVIICLWSWFNYTDYGSIHIFDRPVGNLSFKVLLKMGAYWLVCLGGILPYSPLYFQNAFQRLNRCSHWAARIILSLIPALIVVIVYGAYAGTIDEQLIGRLLAILFLLNGIGICFLLIRIIIGSFTDIFSDKQETTLVLCLWVFFGVLFIVCFSPVMATRHVLLVITPVSLLLGRLAVQRYCIAFAALLVFITASLSLALGISDRIWADFYRKQAALIRNELPQKANVYFSGHWGWQWYAKQNGMVQLEASRPQIKAGDYLVYADGIAQQSLKNIPQELRLKVIKIYSAEWDVLSLFSTRGSYACFYKSSLDDIPPWTLTRRPIPPITLSQVETASSQGK